MSEKLLPHGRSDSPYTSTSDPLTIAVAPKLKVDKMNLVHSTTKNRLAVSEDQKNSLKNAEIMTSFVTTN